MCLRTVTKRKVVSYFNAKLCTMACASSHVLARVTFTKPIRSGPLPSVNNKKSHLVFGSALIRRKQAQCPFGAHTATHTRCQISWQSTTTTSYQPSQRTTTIKKYLQQIICKLLALAHLNALSIALSPRCQLAHRKIHTSININLIAHRQSSWSARLYCASPPNFTSEKKQSHTTTTTQS